MLCRHARLNSIGRDGDFHPVFCGVDKKALHISAKLTDRRFEMSIIRKFIGPKSKYDKSLPFMYEACIDVLYGQGDAPVYNYYQCDTVCGLIEYLDENGIAPEDVQLYGIYSGKKIQLDTNYCTNIEGEWLRRPEICIALEEHFRETLEAQYKGHRAFEECDFDDRDRTGGGPF